MSSGMKNDSSSSTREDLEHGKECEEDQSGSNTCRSRLSTRKIQKREESPGCRKVEESSGVLKRCVSESHVKPSTLMLSDMVQDACGVKPLLTEVSKSYRNSLIINHKLPARSMVTPSGSQMRLSLRLLAGKLHCDSLCQSQDSTSSKKDKSPSQSSDGFVPGGMDSTDGTDDRNQVKGATLSPLVQKRLPNSNDLMLAERIAMWDPWAGIGVAVDQVEQRPVVVVHSEPVVTTFSILKNGRPISEQGAGAAPSQEKRVKWRETVDVILYSGDSEVDRHTEQLREEWVGRSFGFTGKRGTIDRCPYIDPGPLH